MYSVSLFSLQSLVTGLGRSTVQAITAREHLKLIQGPLVVPVVNDNAMDIEEETPDEPEKEAEEELVVDMPSALRYYDGGKCFDGIFEELSEENQLLNKDQVAPYEAQLRKKLHLYSQLCLADISLLSAALDLYAAAEFRKSHAEADQSVEESSSIYPIFQKILKSELSNIIPAMSHHHRPEQIFERLVRSDPLSLPLLEYILELVLPESHIPASTQLIEKVTLFVDRVFPPPSSTNESIGDESRVAQRLSFFIPLLGGFSVETLENIYLPDLVKIFSDKPDKLRAAFHRIVNARPPPLTKTALLVSLHR